MSAESEYTETLGFGPCLDQMHGLGLKIETGRLREIQSRTWSHNWDSEQYAPMKTKISCSSLQWLEQAPIQVHRFNYEIAHSYVGNTIPDLFHIV